MNKRLRSIVVGAVSLGLIVPTGTALARAPRSDDARPETARAQSDHPTVTLDRVYRGTVDGALGPHVWTGDVFGLGIETTVTYEIGLDADGVPVVTSVVVDETTLPEGVSYTMRSRTSATDRDDEATASDSDGSEGSAEAPTGEPGASTEVDASTVASPTDEPASTDQDTGGDAAEDGVSAITRFSAAAGVRFTMGERWAGLLILVNGAVGEEESVAYVRTVLVSPPANGRDDGSSEQPTEVATDPGDTAAADEVARPERERKNHPNLRDRDRGRDDDRGTDRPDRRDRNAERNDRGRRDAR